MVINRAIGQAPVNAEAESSPEILELLLVFNGELLAQFNKVASADWNLVARLRAILGCAGFEGRHEVVVVGERGVTPHPVVVLDPALSGKTVVVPAHRIENLFAAHALIAGLQIHVGIAKDVADVETARSCGRGSVNSEHVVFAAAKSPLTIKAIRPTLFPRLSPECFQAFEGWFIGNPCSHGDHLLRYWRHRVQGASV